MSIDARRMQELLKAVEARHEEYLRSLRQLYESAPPASAVPPRIAAPPCTTTAKAASIASVPSPPLRALTFASDILPIRGRTRRSSTLEAPERPLFLPPSPRPLLPATPIPGHGLFDEDISFIPLLDLSHAGSSTAGAATTATTTNKPPIASARTDKTLPPVRFSDDAFLAFLRDATFTEEMAAVLDEMLRRRHEIDSAGSVREFAAYERERYVSSTFEAYEIDEDGAATKMSVDAAAAADDDLAKGPADGDGGAADDGVIDAPIVWDALKTVNASGDAVGRITYVFPLSPPPLPFVMFTVTHKPPPASSRSQHRSCSPRCSSP